jgi:maltose-binding protein MalE
VQGCSKLMTAVLAIVVALALAACGSSANTDSTSQASLSKQEYKAFLAKLTQRESKAQAQIQSGLHAKSAAKLAEALESFSANEEQVSEELASVTPPDDEASANAALAAAFGKAGTEGQKAAGDIADAGSVPQALKQLQKEKGPQEAGREIDAAIGRLAKLGYTGGS